jgi:hypothetical protein
MMLPVAEREIEGLVACAATNPSASFVAVAAIGFPIWVAPLKKVIVPLGALPMLPAVVFRLGVVSTSAVTVNDTLAFAVVGALGIVGYVGA